MEFSEGVFDDSLFIAGKLQAGMKLGRWDRRNYPRDPRTEPGEMQQSRAKISRRSMASHKFTDVVPIRCVWWRLINPSLGDSSLQLFPD